MKLFDAKKQRPKLCLSAVLETKPITALHSCDMIHHITV